MISAELIKKLTENKISYEREYPLKNASTFRIGGTCDLAVFPRTAEQLAVAVGLLDSEGVRVHICGRGSNTLFFDGMLDLAVVFCAGVDSIDIEGTHLSCGAGVGLVPLASVACNAGLSGLEFASGIPGSVGGAVFMNAGAYGSSMESVVVSSQAYDRNTQQIITVTDHGFGYRKSIYKSNTELVCLGARMKLTSGNKEDIKAEIRRLTEERRKKQPLEYPSAGSYFKRPEGDFAGRLIEVCGLKGARVGGACVSEKHAGFIVNLGGATFDDVLRLEEMVKETVKRETGVTLEREVEMIV